MRRNKKVYSSRVQNIVDEYDRTPAEHRENINFSKKITNDQAQEVLQAGAMGIGEDHTNPTGRRLAIELIENGGVKRFFPELPFTSDFGIDNGVKKRDELRDYYSGKNNGKNENEIEAIIKEEVQKVCMTGFALFCCEIPLSAVIASAIMKAVPVHCVETVFGNSRDRRTVVERNIAIVEGIQAVSEKHEKSQNGYLLLFGGAHFEGPGSITSLHRNLKWVDHSR